MRYLTEGELQTATRFLFLSMAIVVFEQDKKHVQNGAFKIKDPYLDLLDHMISEATNERRHLRKIMKDQKIQVISLDKNDTFSSYLFVCQGREEKRNYFNPAIRNKVKNIIQEFVQKTRPHYQQTESPDD